MKAKRLADRVRDLEGKVVGELFRGEDDAVLPLEQRPELSADRLVLCSVDLYARILQRVEQLARTQREASIAHTVGIVMPEPLGTDVITSEKLVFPCLRVDHVAVPLDQQHVRRLDVSEQRLQYEFGIFGTGCERRDGAYFHLRRYERAIAQHEHARKADARGGQPQCAQGEQWIRGVDAAQRDRRKLKHRRSWGSRRPKR